ncbi:MAG: hypothetical protein IKD06_04860 [Clostridia bacterium]|nr:hypothetical protein [Clostridia bacterium]
MKKTLVLFLALFFMLGLFGCESEELKSARTLIDSIGEVTLESEAAIVAAEEAVALLEKKEVEKLENLSVMKDARAYYDKLVEREEKQDEMVANVEKKINAIGTVTVSNGHLIAEARKAFNNLKALPMPSKTGSSSSSSSSDRPDSLIGEENEGEKTSSNVKIPAAPETLNDLQQRVSNYQVLLDAEQSYIDVRVADIEKAVDAIGEVTLAREAEVKAAIANAQAVYDSYPEEIRALVDNYEKVAQASATLSDLKVKNVIALINAIGTVKLESEEAITAARTAYNKLTSAERKNVTNYDTYTAANTKLNELKKEAKEKAEIEEARSLIRITKFYVGSPNSVGGVRVYINFINMSKTKTIKYFNFSFWLLNAVGDYVDCEIEDSSYFRCYKTGPYGPGEGLTDGSWNWGPYYNWDIEDAELSSVSIEYTDGTTFYLNSKQIEAVRY